MRIVKRMVVILVVLALIVGQALSDRGGEAISGTRSFAIDGRKFLAEDPAVDGFSLVERELSKRGIDTLPISKNLYSMIDPRSVDPLREELADKCSRPLPPGLEPDHVLRLETVTGPVDIAFGRVVCGEKDLLARLRSSGWGCRESDTYGAPGAIAQLTNGKEASFVLLEENGRRFLAIRRASR